MNKPVKFTSLILLCFSLLCIYACSNVPPPKNNKAYITNQGDNTVSVIDLSSHEVIKTISVGKAPVGVATASQLKRVYISNVESQDISVIDTVSHKVMETIKIEGSPVGLALSPDNKRLYVADWF